MDGWRNYLPPAVAGWIAEAGAARSTSQSVVVEALTDFRLLFARSLSCLSVCLEFVLLVFPAHICTYRMIIHAGSTAKKYSLERTLDAPKQAVCFFLGAYFFRGIQNRGDDDTRTYDSTYVRPTSTHRASSKGCHHYSICVLLYCCWREYPRREQNRQLTSRTSRETQEEREETKTSWLWTK